MALHSELPVYRDTYQMLLRIYALTQDFGREFKYTLGQDMKRDSLHLPGQPPLSLVFRRSRVTKDNKYGRVSDPGCFTRSNWF